MTRKYAYKLLITANQFEWFATYCTVANHFMSLISSSAYKLKILVILRIQLLHMIISVVNVSINNVYYPILLRPSYDFQ